MKNLFALLIILALCGCSTAGGSAQSTNTYPLYEPPAGSIVRAVCAGLIKVDIAAYNGWDGECPGTDVDAKTVYGWCEHAQKRRLMLNEECTKSGLVSAIFAMASGLTSNDLLIISLSGHGGQVDDTNGDEEDGKDETICLWDGQMVDDDFKTNVVDKLACRVLLITDTCHSEGNFKAFARWVTRGMLYGKEPFAVDETPKQMEFEFMRDAKITRQLIQLAACREQSYSYGAETGGTWTQTLDANKTEDQSLKAWYEVSENNMPKNQTPAWVEDGDVTDQFRYVRALH